MKIFSALIGALLFGAFPVFGADATPLRVLALGDSYTIGEGVPPTDRWPAQTVALMRAAGFTVDNPLFVAQTGWTTAGLREGIARAKPIGPFDIVTLMIGVNNQYQGLDRRDYRDEFARLLKQAIHFAGDRPSRVIVLSIPDWGVTPFAKGQNARLIAKEIDAFNAINKAATDAAHAHYVDVTAVSRNVDDDPTLIASDGLHPSAKMYAQWAALVWPMIQQELNAPAH